MRLSLPYRTWMDDAACVSADPEAFFPEKGESSRYAMRVCAGCPVLEAFVWKVYRGEAEPPPPPRPAVNH